MEIHFTQSEWRVREVKPDFDIVTNDPDEGEYILASVYSGYNFEQEANAKLIAAAPEMIDVIFKLLQYGESPELIQQASKVFQKATVIQ